MAETYIVKTMHRQKTRELWCIYTRIFLAIKKGNPDTCDQMDGPQGYFVN